MKTHALRIILAASLHIGATGVGNAADPPPKQDTTMPKKPAPKSVASTAELHQTTADPKQTLTTNHGLQISDNQNSLKAGGRGPTLIEDFVLREKITHFDHERIPERIVHARGSGAHGYFQVYESQKEITKAAFLQDPAVKTEVFVRFSTVAGGAGSGGGPGQGRATRRTGPSIPGPKAGTTLGHRRPPRAPDMPDRD